MTNTNINYKRINALKLFLEVEKEDIKTIEYDNNTFICGNGEYMVLTDLEATKQAKNYIKESLWAFNKNFIMSNLNSRFNNMDEEIVENIIDIAQEKYEDGNDSIKSIIRINDFIKDAIMCDGRGHFISSYDGEEQEQGNYYIYRTN